MIKGATPLPQTSQIKLSSWAQWQLGPRWSLQRACLPHLDCGFHGGSCLWCSKGKDEAFDSLLPLVPRLELIQAPQHGSPFAFPAQPPPGGGRRGGFCSSNNPLLTRIRESPWCCPWESCIQAVCLRRVAGPLARRASQSQDPTYHLCQKTPTGGEGGTLLGTSALKGHSPSILLPIHRVPLHKQSHHLF